jgi:hypothetical protein
VLIFLYVNHEDFQNLCAGMTAGWASWKINPISCIT